MGVRKYYENGRIEGVARTLSPPDPEPARRVRRALACDLRDGLPWSEERFLEIVAAEGGGHQLALRWSRAAWEDAYEHRGDRLIAV